MPSVRRLLCDSRPSCARLASAGSFLPPPVALPVAQGCRVQPLTDFLNQASGSGGVGRQSAAAQTINTPEMKARRRLTSPPPPPIKIGPLFSRLGLCCQQPRSDCQFSGHRERAEAAQAAGAGTCWSLFILLLLKPKGAFVSAGRSYF